MGKKSVSALAIGDLPDRNDSDAVLAFAQSFNGYDHFGSFEACAQNANAARRETLVDLRNELFFCWRACAHQGSSGCADLYAELLPEFRRLLGGD